MKKIDFYVIPKKAEKYAYLYCFKLGKKIDYEDFMKEVMIKNIDKEIANRFGTVYFDIYKTNGELIKENCNYYVDGVAGSVEYVEELFKDCENESYIIPKNLDNEEFYDFKVGEKIGYKEFIEELNSKNLIKLFMNQYKYVYFDIYKINGELVKKNCRYDVGEEDIKEYSSKILPVSEEFLEYDKKIFRKLTTIKSTSTIDKIFKVVYRVGWIFWITIFIYILFDILTR